MAVSPDIDAVQISTPPFFHVEHLDALVAGGKHVYCEKPVGVDVPQTRRALEIADRINGKVSVAVGFQIRKATPFVEIVQRNDDGQIGKIASLNAYNNTPRHLTQIAVACRQTSSACVTGSGTKRSRATFCWSRMFMWSMFVTGSWARIP